jgi:hypothetical protein
MKTKPGFSPPQSVFAFSNVSQRQMSNVTVLRRRYVEGVPAAIASWARPADRSGRDARWGSAG